MQITYFFMHGLLKIPVENTGFIPKFDVYISSHTLLGV